MKNRNEVAYRLRLTADEASVRRQVLREGAEEIDQLEKRVGELLVNKKQLMEVLTKVRKEYNEAQQTIKQQKAKIEQLRKESSVEAKVKPAVPPSVAAWITWMEQNLSDTPTNIRRIAKRLYGTVTLQELDDMIMTDVEQSLEAKYIRKLVEERDEAQQALKLSEAAYKQLRKELWDIRNDWWEG